jgi:hypothetical protein
MNLTRRAYALTTFLILILCYAYFMPKWGDWGANSRANLVYAVGDQGVLYIDDYHENTGDKACFPGPYDLETDTCAGHYYTDKSLGPSLLALPPYMVFRVLAQVPPLKGFIENGQLPGNFADTLNPEGRGTLQESVYQGMAITFFATSVPSALLGPVVFLFADRFARRSVYAFILALAFGLATIAFPYSNTLIQHQLAAFGVFTGFYLLWRVIYERAHVRWLWLVGLLFGLVAITDYPVVVMGGIVFLWAALVYPQRLNLYRVILGALPLGLLFMAYNYTIFGTPMPVGYEYSTLWQDSHGTGFLSLTMPSLARYYGLTFSPIRGIFLISPFLLLFFPGLVLMWRRQSAQRSTTIAIFLAVFALLTFYASSVMWWGGHTVGPRYIVPIMPFMALPIIFAFNALLRRSWGIVLTSVLLVAAVLHVWALTIAGQSWPPQDAFPLTVEQMNEVFLLTDYALPLLQQGNIARNYGGILLNLDGWSGLLPLVIGVLALALGLPALLLRTPRPNQRQDPKHQQLPSTR